jgi:HAE1 family hydrophobic/amphiphilic exporter-1
MIILALVVMGYRAFTLLKLDRFPAVDFPFVTVVTVFPGASPEDVEELVVKPIEDAVSTISGIDELTSQATEGVGTVTIAFVEGTDGNNAAIDVERQISGIKGQLPDEAEDPTIIKADLNAIPVLVMALSGSQSQDALFDLAENTLKSRLQGVEGVASVSVSGGREREVQVNVDPAKLAAFGMSLGGVQQALSANNITFPAGSIEEGRQKLSVRSVGEFKSLQEIEDIVINTGGGGGGSSNGPAPAGQDSGGYVRLRDVATVSYGLKDQGNKLRYNGQDAISISAIKSSQSNTVEVVDNLTGVIDEINAELPAGAKLTIVNDNASFIKDSVAAVLEDLILAVIITGLVMLVFLHTVRSTFIVLLAIPTSIISTFLVMWMLGFSLNQLTLLALTLVIGILVDDSIVVIENIQRHLKMKKPRKQAAIDGRREIGLAAITITLVDVVVYLPVAFTSGIVGQFFFSYGVTIAVAALASLFVAFTLTPMLAGFWMKDESQPEAPPRGLRKYLGYLFRPVGWLWNGFIYLWEKGFNLLANFYGLTLRFFLWNFFTQSFAVILAVLALVGGFYLVAGGFVGAEFFPQEDDGQIRINLEMPPGTNLDTTDIVSRQIEQIILNNVPEATGILTRVGGGGGGGFDGGSRASNLATINLTLVDKEDRERTTTEVVEELRPRVQLIPEALITVALNSSMGGGGMGSAIQVQIFGADPDRLIDLANDVESVISTVPGTVDVKNTDALRAPETELQVNRDSALDLGLSPVQVATTLRTALSGSQVGDFNPPDGGTEMDITLRLQEESRNDFNQILQMPLSYVNGQPITLDRVVDLAVTDAPARINRSDRQRTLTVGTGVSGGQATGDITDDIEAAIQERVEFPVGYGFKFVGGAEAQRDAFTQLFQAILLAIALVYMLLVALYQSWLQPLAIMFSLPVTLVGAFGGLWITGNTLNLISLLGVVLLTGVVTKNAILIVDFTNNLRQEEGLSRKDALVRAGRLRLRAVLMTTLTLVFALLPLLLGTGAGSETRAPLAAVVIGGTLSSTLLTLILVPVIYNFFDWGGGLAARTFSTILGTRAPMEDEAEEQEQKEQKETDKEKPDRGREPTPRRPAPQAGSAISLNPQAANPDPDAA